MSWSRPTFDQIIPLPKSLDQHWRAHQVTRENIVPKALPASITKVDATGTIVTVKFEVLEPGTNASMRDLHPYYILQFPETEMPVATDLYGIPPLQIGDKGYCVPSDIDLGAVSGYYDGTASLTAQPNLSTLVFHPIGNIQAQKRPDNTKYFLSGPTGVDLQDLSGVAFVRIGPVPEGIGNAIQILQQPVTGIDLPIAGLLNCPDDMTARGQGIPQYGLYHTNGTVKYQYTVP